MMQPTTAVALAACASTAWLSYLYYTKEKPKRRRRHRRRPRDVPRKTSSFSSSEESDNDDTHSLSGLSEASLIKMHSLTTSKWKNVAVLVVDCQPVYYEEQDAVRFANPELPRTVGALLGRARKMLSPPQIVHIRANYTFRFAQNFKLLNPEKPLPSAVPKSSLNFDTPRLNFLFCDRRSCIRS